MNIEEVKKNLVSVLNNLSADKETMAAIKDFVETYDGKNEKEFVTAMMHVVVLLMKLQKLEIKGQAFDEIEENAEISNEALNKIKEDFDRINAGLEPKQPLQVSGTEQ